MEEYLTEVTKLLENEILNSMVALQISGERLKLDFKYEFNNLSTTCPL